MSDRPMKMSAEQFESLCDMFDADSSTVFREARIKARRLLVGDDEESKADQPKYYGECKGGPLKMARVGSDDDVVPVTRGAYHWSHAGRWWVWVEDQTKPIHDGPCKDLTTFGELEPGDWFRLRSGNNQRAIMKMASFAAHHGVLAADEKGESYGFDDDRPVRRLPKPEFSE